MQPQELARTEELQLVLQATTDCSEHDCRLDHGYCVSGITDCIGLVGDKIMKRWRATEIIVDSAVVADMVECESDGYYLASEVDEQLKVAEFQIKHKHEQLEQVKPYIGHLRTCPSYSLVTDACIGRQCTCGLQAILEIDNG
jgi:hypothetical protein